jgi:hypothetical protein
MQAIFVISLTLLLMLFRLNVSLGGDAQDLQSLGVGHMQMDISCVPRGFQELSI